ncbi:MAG: hypothetical protein ACP5G1_00035 [Nanopusillaceae archaeon]
MKLGIIVGLSLTPIYLLYNNLNNYSYGQNSQISETLITGTIETKYLFWVVTWGKETSLDKIIQLSKQSNNIKIGLVDIAESSYHNERFKSFLRNLCNKTDGEMFINEFFYTQRNDKTDIDENTLNNYIDTLKYISNVCKNKRNVTIFFSEMDSMPLDALVDLYKITKEYLPNAKFGYYTNFNQNPEYIIELYKKLDNLGIKLSYVGYDIWPVPGYVYKKENGKIAIPKQYVDMYLKPIIKFAKDKNITLFIGEIGFRNGDPEGYLYPAEVCLSNNNCTKTKDYEKTIGYLIDVIEDLKKIVIDNNYSGEFYIGIWNLNGANDDTFGIGDNPYFDRLINYMIKDQ